MVNEIIILIIIALLLAMVFIKYIWFSAGRELDRFMKLEVDPEFRVKRLREINTSLSQKIGDEAELLYEKAHIYALGEEYQKSARSFVAYLKLENEDPEGWAELADAYIGCDEFSNAREAIEKAVELEPRYQEYRAIQMRIGMHLQDIDYANKAYRIWSELDAQRVKINKRPHRWSPLYQIGYKEAFPDPAIKVYGAAIKLDQGDTEQAAELLREVDNDEPDYLQGLFAEDRLLAGLKELYESE